MYYVWDSNSMDKMTYTIVTSTCDNSASYVILVLRFWIKTGTSLLNRGDKIDKKAKIDSEFWEETFCRDDI